MENSEADCLLNGQFEPCINGYCAVETAVNKRGAFLYYSSYCSDECRAGTQETTCLNSTSLANITDDINIAQICYNCTGGQQGCLDECIEMCPTTIDCPACTEDTLENCELVQTYQECAVGQITCETLYEYEIRGRLISVTKQCGDLDECIASIEPNCIDTVQGTVLCAECSTDEAICHVEATPTPSGCTGQPNCFKCSATNYEICTATGHYVECPFNDYCGVQEEKTKRGALINVTSDCASVLFGLNITITECPFDNVCDTDGTICDACMAAHRCGEITDNCTMPMPTCKMCTGYDQTSCDAVAHNMECPGTDYVCIARYYRDQRGTIQNFTRGCEATDAVTSCPHTEDCVATDITAGSAHFCTDCTLTVPQCLETPTPGVCPVDDSLACLVCNETGLRADENCALSGIWTACSGSNVTCVETVGWDSRGTVIMFDRECSNVDTCAVNNILYSPAQTCVYETSGARQCQSCHTTDVCLAESGMCPVNEDPVCLLCMDAPDESTCIADNSTVICLSGICRIIEKTDFRGNIESYTSECVTDYSSACDGSMDTVCTNSTVTGQTTCRMCEPLYECSGDTTTVQTCDAGDIFSCFECTGTSETDCLASPTGGWTTCASGHCGARQLMDQFGLIQSYERYCEASTLECTGETTCEDYGINWVRCTTCTLSDACLCTGDTSVCNDLGKVGACPTCVNATSSDACLAENLYLSCPRAYCYTTTNTLNGVTTIDMACSDTVCNDGSILCTSDAITGVLSCKTCNVANSTITVTPITSGTDTETTTATIEVTTTETAAQRYNCSSDEVLRCLTCTNVADAAACQTLGSYQTCYDMVDPRCEIKTQSNGVGGFFYSSQCLEEVNCVETVNTVCDIASCMPATYSVGVFLTLDAPFNPAYATEYSLEWWSVCLDIQAAFVGAYIDINGFVGITCGPMVAGSIHVLYHVLNTQPVDETMARLIAQRTLTRSLNTSNSLVLNNTVVPMKGTYTIINVNGNITAVPFLDICQDFAVVCANGGTCFYNETSDIANCFCADGYSGPTCLEVVSTFQDLLPIVIPLGVLAPVALIMVALLVVVSIRHAKSTKQKKETKTAAETINKYHVSDTGSWSSIHRAFSPDYRRNWRSFMGAGGFYGDVKDYQWDPDEASVVTVHRDKFLSGKNWNFSNYDTDTRPIETEDDEMEDIVRRAREDNIPSGSSEQRDTPSDEFRIPRPVIRGRNADRFPFRLPQFQGLRGLNRPMSLFSGSTPSSES